MQNQHIRSGEFHFLFVQNIEVFHTDIIVFVEETFFLYSCHVKNIQFWQCVFETGYFLKLMTAGSQNIFTDIVRDTEFFRGDQDEFYIRIANQSFDQRVYGTSKLQIAAKTDRNIIQSSFQRTNRQ